MTKDNQVVGRMTIRMVEFYKDCIQSKCFSGKGRQKYSEASIVRGKPIHFLLKLRQWTVKEPLNYDMLT